MKKYTLGVHPYEEWRVYGPYIRKDGRKHVILAHSANGNKKTVSYPKFLVEIREGRLLDVNETVDHNDRNFMNDELDNLVIRDRSAHASLDNSRRIPETFTCEICNKEFILSGIKLHDATIARGRMKAGPYCSKSCAGKASHLSERLVKKIRKRYYYVDKRA